jgi:hypothetical protein
MLIWVQFVVLLGARLLWQRRPGLATCGLFWGIAFAGVLEGWSLSASQFLLALGILCNALVTLANGGFMPVAAHRRLDSRARSLWVERQSGQKLLFLADNFGTRFLRFSIGDLFLLAGIVLAFLGP